MTRGISNNELKILRSIYFCELDYDKIILTTDHLFSKILKKYTAIVFDNKIVYSKSKYQDDFSKSIFQMSILVHEVCHVWQFQNLKYRWMLAGLEHMFHRKSTYSYNINDHRILTDFRFEQQGEIMADYYKLRSKGDAKAEQYEKVIYKTIKKC